MRVVRAGQVIRRSRLALLALVGISLGADGCRTRDTARKDKPTRVPFATQVAYGRPAACPDDAIDPYGDGTPSPMDLRCSYTDGTGGVLTRVRGHVMLEGPPGSTGDPPGRVEVVMHEAPRGEGPLGPEVAHASTDPQGAFTMGVKLRRGEYVLVVRDEAGGRPRAQQRVTVGGQDDSALDRVRLVIPRALDDEDEVE
jgi:hypothetical protein